LKGGEENSNPFASRKGRKKRRGRKPERRGEGFTLAAILKRGARPQRKPYRGFLSGEERGEGGSSRQVMQRRERSHQLRKGERRCTVVPQGRKKKEGG